MLSPTQVVAVRKAIEMTFETITQNGQDDIKANVSQTTKLFIAPEITIKDGSRIEVTDVLGKKTIYKSSGQPAIYQTHQEIMLELVERYA